MKNDNLKLLSAVFAMIMIMMSVLCFSASADEAMTAYSIPEVPMTIDIPTEVTAITPAVKRSDTRFSNGTFDYISAMTKMRDDSAMIYGKNIRENYEIEITVAENTDGVKNFSKLKDKKLEKMLSKYASQPDIVESSVYSSNGIVYFYAAHTVNSDAGRFFFSDYYTVHSGTDIKIRIISENDNLKDSELAVLKQMADSVRFPEKQHFSFAKMNGKGVLITFVIIVILFAGMIAYRRHDEAVNTFVLKKAGDLKQLIDEKKAKSKNKALEKNAESAPSNDIEGSADPEKNVGSLSDGIDDDEDLSSIDLDEAIAAFDDSRH